MTTPLLNTETASVGELLEQARLALETDPSESPALLLTAVNKVLAEIAPDEEPAAAAKRLSVEQNRWGIEAGYKALLYYYEDSLSPSRFSFWEDFDLELHLEIADDMVRILKESND